MHCSEYFLIFRYSYDQIDLGQLHSLLEARFGRGTRKGKHYGVHLDNIPSFPGSGDAVRSSVPTIPYFAPAGCKTPRAASFVSSSANFAAMAASCGAIERVRRNLLLAGKKEGARWGGLRHALAAASGSGDGSLTKV